MSLRAPIAVPVEIRSPARRCYRLAWNAGEDGVRLVRSCGFERGRPVEARFALPGGTVLALAARVEAGEQDDDELVLLDPPAEARQALRRYVHERLGLPA